MKKQQTTGILAKIAGAALIAVLVFGADSLNALADSAGQITATNAKVRSDASTSASELTTVSNGTQVTVTDEKTDSSGNLWYHVSLSDGTVGYIRSDLMTVTASVPDNAGEEAGDTLDAGTLDALLSTSIVDVTTIVNPDDVAPQDFQMAVMKPNIGKVRSNASTNDDIVAQLPQGTEMVVSGSKAGSDSKTWYYVSFLDSGVQKSGYVRSDLVDMGEVISMPAPEPAEPAETETAETDAAEPVVNNDYEVVYTDDGEGNNVWWLYNHINNTREKLQELLDYAEAQPGKIDSLNASIKKFKIICIVLGVLLAIAIAAIIFLVIRLMSGGYEYEDDDEEEEERPARRQQTERRSTSAREERRPSTRERSARRYEEDDDDDNNDASETRTAAPASRKPKNFMLDDDDFEFEFLNVDDK